VKVGIVAARERKQHGGWRGGSGMATGVGAETRSAWRAAAAGVGCMGAGRAVKAARRSGMQTSLAALRSARGSLWRLRWTLWWRRPADGGGADKKRRTLASSVGEKYGAYLHVSCSTRVTSRRASKMQQTHGRNWLRLAARISIAEENALAATLLWSLAVVAANGGEHISVVTGVLSVGSMGAGVAAVEVAAYTIGVCLDRYKEK